MAKQDANKAPRHMASFTESNHNCRYVPKTWQTHFPPSTKMTCTLGKAPTPIMTGSSAECIQCCAYAVRSIRQLQHSKNFCVNIQEDRFYFLQQLLTDDSYNTSPESVDGLFSTSTCPATFTAELSLQAGLTMQQS